MVKLFTSCPGDLGSIPGRVIPKTPKMMPPCLTLSIIRYGLKVKWRNTAKGVAPSSTSCGSIYIYIYICVCVCVCVCVCDLVWVGLVLWVSWHIKRVWVISCQILFMHIYQIYMNCKRIICCLTFLDKPELTCLHTVIHGAILANTSTSI